MSSTTERAGKNYGEYTSKASEISRSLGLAAIGITWLFAGGLASIDTPQGTLDALADSDSLRWGLILTVASLTADLLQYAFGALAWGLFRWALDQVKSNDRDAAAISRRGRAGWWLLKYARTVKAIETNETAGPLLVGPKPSAYKARRVRVRAAMHDSTAKPAVLAVVDAYVPPWIPGVTVALWTLKLGFLAAGYLFILIYLWP